MPSYYGNVNHTLLNEVDVSAERILELGCGAGALARAVRLRAPHVHYVGMDFASDALEQAHDVLDHSLVCNLDDVPLWSADARLTEALPYESFDHVILGDVLEHLYQPEGVLAQAVQRLKPGGRALVCIPNVQHWSVLGQLILGQWPRQDSGLFDRTHIRWFTLRDMHVLLQGCGLIVEKVIPRIFQPERGMPLLQALEAATRVMNVDPLQFRQLSLPLQYVLVGRKPLK